MAIKSEAIVQSCVSCASIVLTRTGLPFTELQMKWRIEACPAARAPRLRYSTCDDCQCVSHNLSFKPNVQQQPAKCNQQQPHASLTVRPRKRQQTTTETKTQSHCIKLQPAPNISRTFRTFQTGRKVHWQLCQLLLLLFSVLFIHIAHTSRWPNVGFTLPCCFFGFL